MAETNEESVSGSYKLGTDTHESFVHEEHAKAQDPEFTDVQICYDSNGIKGILNSPFVCGAALLASFGGFSFGYGEC